MDNIELEDHLQYMLARGEINEIGFYRQLSKLYQQQGDDYGDYDDGGNFR